MAVRVVTIFQPRDGKREEFLKESVQAKEILTRLGARFRLSETMLGGANTGQMVATTEFDTMAAYSAFTEAAAADRPWREFQAKADRDDSSRTLVSRSLVQDVL